MAIMPPEDKLILAHKRSLRLKRKADDPNIKLLGQFGLSQDEILPDVKVIYGHIPGFPVLFTLWVNQDEIIDISGSDPLPLQNPVMLVMHDQDAERLRERGIDLDVTEMSRSPSYPAWYFKLLELPAEGHLVHVLLRVVTKIGPVGELA